MPEPEKLTHSLVNKLMYTADSDGVWDIIHYSDDFFVPMVTVGGLDGSGTLFNG